MATREKKPVAAAEPATPHDRGRFELRPAGELVPWPDLNPRTHFDNERIAELVESIRKRGIHVPLLAHDDGGPALLIVAGERRWRAAMEIGEDTLVPCLIRSYTWEEALEIALIENLDRADLTAVEEARGFQRLLELPGMTQTKLAEKIGRSQPYIANRVRLLDLPEESLSLVEDGLIEPTAARDLLLPFAHIPEAKREKLYAGVAEKIRGDKDGRWRTTQDIRRLIGDVASKLSHSLRPNQWDQGAPKFNVALHAKCTCNGPEYEYSYLKERRCFDDPWWTEHQRKAKASSEERKEKSIAKALEKAEQLGGRPVLSDKLFHAKYGYNDHRVLADRGEAKGHLVDPALLPAESLVLVKGTDSIALACIDMKAYRTAEEAVKEERLTLLAERQGERAAREKAEVARLGIEPWMLREMLRPERRVGELNSIAAEHGITTADHDLEDDDDEDEWVQKLSDADVSLLFRIAALRARNIEGDRYFYRDPLEEAVNDELTQKYAPLIEALLPASEKGAEDEDVEASSDYTCVECGCTDSEACADGCHWLVRDAGRRVGVCSSCADTIPIANRILNDSITAGAA